MIKVVKTHGCSWMLLRSPKLGVGSVVPFDRVKVSRERILHITLQIYEAIVAIF